MSNSFSYEDATAPAANTATAGFSYEDAAGEPAKEASISDRVGFGVRRMVNSARTTLTDDPNKIAQIASEQAKAAPAQSAAALQMQEEIKPYTDAANNATGVVDTVKTWGALGAKRAGQLISNPGETVKMIAEQLPNSVPGLAGAVAGAKAGAMAGTAVAPGVGTAIGAVGGGVLGGLAGGYLTEKGAAVQEQVQTKAAEQGIDLQDQQAVAGVVRTNQAEIDKAATLKAVGTAGTDAVLNVLTAGLSGMGRRILGNEVATMAEAVKAGRVSTAEAVKQLGALEARAVAQSALPATIARGAAVTGAEMLGEGVSEAVGQKLAYGKVDAGDVVDESLLGLGQGVAMAGASSAANRIAGTPDRDQIQQNIASLRERLQAGQDATPAQGAAADPLMLPNSQPDRLYAFPDGTVGRTGEVESYLANLPEDQREAARLSLMGRNYTEVNDPQAQQARRWWENYGDGQGQQERPDYLADVQAAVRSGTPFTTQQTVETVRNAMEDAWLAQNVDPATSETADAADEVGAQLQGEFEQVGGDTALAAVDARVRTGRVLTGLQNILDAGADNSLQVLGRLNTSLTRIDEQPLTGEEAGRVRRIVDAYMGFRGVGEPAPLPSLAARAMDRNADNAAMEALIPERPSQAMGINPAAGPLSFAAASLVDTRAATGLAARAMQPRAQPQVSADAPGGQRQPQPSVTGATGDSLLASQSTTLAGRSSLSDAILRLRVEKARANPSQAQALQTQAAQADAARTQASAPVGSDGAAVAGLPGAGNPATASPGLTPASLPAPTQEAQTDGTRSLETAQTVQATAQGPTQGPDSPAVAGRELGEGWTAFAPESGTKGVPRAEMPQIKAAHRGAMVNFMGARGVTHAEETVSAADLKPTQAEFSREKVARAMASGNGERSILVSRDGHVLDGHHQWLAARERGEPVKAIRLDAPIDDLIGLAREFPSSTVSQDGASPSQPEPAGAAEAPLAAVPQSQPNPETPEVAPLGASAPQGVQSEPAQEGQTNDQPAAATTQNPDSAQSSSVRVPGTPADGEAAQTDGAQRAVTQQPGPADKKAGRQMGPGLHVGSTPGTAERVTVRDGVVFIGRYEALNFETAAPVTVAPGSSRAKVAKALQDAGVLTSGQKLFGLSQPDEAVGAAARSGGAGPILMEGSRPIDADMVRRILTPAPAMSVEETRVAVMGMAKNWRNGPTVRVVATPADLPGKPPNDARGLYLNGVAYIVASRHHSGRAVLSTLAHEVIAHHGLAAMVGQIEWARTMSAIQKGLASGDTGLLALQADVRRVYTDSDGQFNLSPQQEADEIAARAVEVGFDAKTGEFRTGFEWVKRAYSRIAQFLRNLGFDVRITNAELQGMLARAQRFLANPAKGNGFVVGDEQVAGVMARDVPSELDMAVIGHDLGTANNHPRYAAAKAGDVDAAVDVAKSLVTPELVAKVRAAIGDAQPVVVPVVAEEAAGRNKIPLAAAVALSKALGTTYSNDILQANTPRRTGLDGLGRIFAPVEFDGQVVPGQTYLLLDDTLTQGGTFKSLANFIEAGGGRVVGAVALTGKQYSAKIGLTPSTLQTLREKHGASETDFRAATGYGFDALTESEARYLANFKPADAVRTRIAEAGRQGRQQADRGAAGPVDSGGAAARGPSPVEASMGQMSPAQESAWKRVAGLKKVPTIKERAQKMRANLGLKLRQGIVDQFAPIRELDQNAYMLARMSKGSDGTLEAALLYGKPFLRDGVPDVDVREGGFAKTLASLKGEHDRFLWWVAAQRAERLKAEGKENLMTDQDIKELKTLNAGRMSDGTARMLVYGKALREMNEFNDSVLKMARDSGLIDQEAFDLFQGQPYVPFFRVMEEEGGMRGPTFGAGLTNQKAWQKLKGGSQQLNGDLLENMLLNWSHLYAAAARNRAGVATMDAASAMGVAYEVSADTKGAIKIMRDGRAEHWAVEDPYLLDAISSLHYVPSPLMKPLAKMKQLLTLGVTISPTFKIRNLIRDSVSAIAQADLSYNPGKNVAQGWKLSASDSQVYASMLASGGVIKFGTQENTNRLRAQVAKLGGQVLDQNAAHKLWGMVKTGWSVYEELGDRAENVNRVALYDQLIKKGHSHAEASFMARDLMDFSMSGAFPVVRFLTQTVPFLNARLVGLDKLGRAAMDDPRRFAAVTGAVVLASLALMAMYQDDDDWKRREDWDRDAFWWFKIGNTAFRIPKPFEIGAIGTLAERTAELMLSEEMTAKRYGERLRHMLAQTFAFDPVPQAFKPLLDVYANRDSFTGRAIETQADQRLRPQDRYTERTSEVAKLLGSWGLPDPAQLLKGEWRDLSPKQVDHLLRGYFSWMAAAGTTVSDLALRPMLDRGERPEMRLKDVFVVGNFAESLPTGTSRYVSQLYEQSRSAEQAFASYREAIKVGDTERAAEIQADEGGKLRNRGALQHATEQMAAINRQARRIEGSREMSAEEKRRRLDDIEQRRHAIAQRVSRLSS